MVWPKPEYWSAGEIAQRAAKEERLRHLPPRTLDERIEDVKVLVEYKRLKEVNPFAAARLGMERATQIESAWLAVDAIRETESGANASPVDALRALESMKGGV